MKYFKTLVLDHNLVNIKARMIGHELHLTIRDPESEGVKEFKFTKKEGAVKGINFDGRDIDILQRSLSQRPITDRASVVSTEMKLDHYVLQSRKDKLNLPNLKFTIDRGYFVVDPCILPFVKGPDVRPDIKFTSNMQSKSLNMVCANV